MAFRKTDILIFFAVAFVTCAPILCAENIPAFPGAEGFGAQSRGGRGGKIIFVTNLNDDVRPGSLRAACRAKAPRTVIFRVSGTIELKSTLNIKEPFITIAGQTAPGDGICTKNYGISINTHDVIIRYMRSRPGDEVGRKLAKKGKKWETDAICIGKPSRNVILDHCSFSWANDEVCSVSGEDITDVTVQWCIISESLNNSTHAKGSHGYGSLIRCNGNVSYHHNLYAFHRSRSPRPGTYGEGSILFDFRNNLMHMGGQGYSAKDPVRMNFVANFHRNTPFKATSTCEYFSSENEGKISGGKKRKEPFKVAEVTTTSAETAAKAIIKSCGAILPKRDPVDTRVIQLVKSGKGNLVNSADEAGRWPKLKSTRSPRDTDRDGMPDEWELKHGLNSKAAGNNLDSDGDGYTDIEEFLNDTNPKVKEPGATTK